MTLSRYAFAIAVMAGAMPVGIVCARDDVSDTLGKFGGAIGRELSDTARSVDKAIAKTLAGKPSKTRSRKDASKDAAKAGTSDKPEKSSGKPEKDVSDIPLPVRKPLDVAAVPPVQPAIQPRIAPSFPKTLPEAKAEAEAAAKPPETWSEAEITEAKARCTAILKRIAAVAIQEAPIRQGACGTPAPIQLISIGKNPEVSISPPAIVTCDLAENLAEWLEKDLQPLARKHLGNEIIKIETMSSYSCRNAYGRAHNKLSEHGIANALDIRGFVTASAKTAMVLEDWGTPQREIIAARIAAEKAAAEAAAKAAAAAAANQAQKTATAENSSQTTTTTKPTIAEGMPADGTAAPSFAESDETSSNARTPKLLVQPSKLGAGNLATAAVPKVIIDIQAALPGKSAKTTGQRAFLHEAHAAACQIFGTTLGPEANAAHRNHFHVDMAKRKVATTKICD